MTIGSCAGAARWLLLDMSVSPLQSRPICYEVFVFCQEECADDAADL
jgi:hypothetical protein